MLLKQGFVGWQGKWQWRAVKWIIEEGWIEIHRLITNKARAHKFWWEFEGKRLGKESAGLQTKEGAESTP